MYEGEKKKRQREGEKQGMFFACFHISDFGKVWGGLWTSTPPWAVCTASTTLSTNLSWTLNAVKSCCFTTETSKLLWAALNCPVVERRKKKQMQTHRVVYGGIKITERKWSCLFHRPLLAWLFTALGPAVLWCYANASFMAPVLFRSECMELVIDCALASYWQKRASRVSLA